MYFPLNIGFVFVENGGSGAALNVVCSCFVP
jgi:hypothetical protein